MAQEFSPQHRSQEIEKIQAGQKNFDLLIIGGGITGAGVARDAALRGLSVCLVEKADFASGTSSRSSKLVHGGVRYLEYMEFELVKESTRERALLWEQAPQLVKPLPFLFPAFKTSRVPLWQLRCGLWLYEILARFKVPQRHQCFSPEKTLEKESLLKSDGLTGSIHYFDGRTNDARLTLACALDAHNEGATLLPRMWVEKIDWNDHAGKSHKRRHLVHCVDQLTGERVGISARTVISATGPWSDDLLEATGKNIKDQKLIAATRGSHIVLSKEKLPLDHAITLTHPVDKRVLFVIPWEEHSIVGTTDLYDEDNPDSVAIRSEEVDYLLKLVKEYFPSTDIKKEDIVSTWSGLRPLLAPPENADPSSISREHHIEWREPGLLLVSGGKLTTFRQMAQDVVDALLKETRKWKRPLSSFIGPCITDQKRYAELEHPTQKAPRLGSSLSSALSEEDIRGICRHQMVLTLEDFMMRRTALFYEEKDQGWSLLSQLKGPLCQELQWDETTWQKNVDQYQKVLERNILSPLGRAAYPGMKEELPEEVFILPAVEEEKPEEETSSEEGTEKDPSENEEKVSSESAEEKENSEEETENKDESESPTETTEES